jgi:hypothetical protein
MTEETKPYCCKIDCDQDATWHLGGPEFEDDTDACDSHFFELLGEGYCWAQEYTTGRWLGGS